MSFDQWLQQNPIVVLALAILGMVGIGYRLVPSFTKLVDAALPSVGISRRNKPKVEAADPMETIPIPPVIQVLESQAQAMSGMVSILGPMVAEQKRANDLHEKDIELAKARQVSQEAVNVERTKSVEVVIKAVQTSLEEIKALRLETANAHLMSVDERNKHLDMMNKVIADNNNALTSVATGVTKVEKTNGDINEKIDRLEKQITDDILPMLKDIQEQVKTLVKRPPTGPLKADPLITPATPSPAPIPEPIITPPPPVVEPAEKPDAPHQIVWPTHKDDKPNV